MDTRTLYTTSAVSRADSRRVEVEGAEPGGLAIVEPPELGGRGDGWDPERLYAAALATCLHQSLVVLASTEGKDTTGSVVRAQVRLGDHGAQSYTIDARLVVELPNVRDPDRRRELVDRAAQHCPLAGGWDVSVG
ncbi:MULTISPECIES: OsmC family protein [Saccharothrix]|uniref:OsmC family protein n=1 Tax=Saccharothrix TaxID=2071 RepID=UPI00093BE1CB|nr:OsmC family protein [Saccharothrix sp. CB00851]OKI28606.1 hypothetical protein A6A25_30820 [Saccharothrix sp. CB00851]